MTTSHDVISRIPENNVFRINGAVANAKRKKFDCLSYKSGTPTHFIHPYKNIHWPIKIVPPNPFIYIALNPIELDESHIGTYVSPGKRFKTGTLRNTYAQDLQDLLCNDSSVEGNIAYTIHTACRYTVAELNSIWESSTIELWLAEAEWFALNNRIRVSILYDAACVSIAWVHIRDIMRTVRYLDPTTHDKFNPQFLPILRSRFTNGMPTGSGERFDYIKGKQKQLEYAGIYIGDEEFAQTTHYQPWELVTIAKETHDGKEQFVSVPVCLVTLIRTFRHVSSQPGHIIHKPGSDTKEIHEETLVITTDDTATIHSLVQFVATQIQPKKTISYIHVFFDVLEDKTSHEFVQDPNLSILEFLFDHYVHKQVHKDRTHPACSLICNLLESTCD